MLSHLLFVVSQTIFVTGYVDVQEKLAYYEVLLPHHVISRRRRSADVGSTFVHEFSFRAYHNDFRLVLYPGSPVMARDFRAKTVYSDGTMKLFQPDLNSVFTGHLAEDTSVPVIAHLEDGVLSCFVLLPNTTYTVEPAWRHIPTCVKGSMIVYRDSDLRSGQLRYSEGIKIDEELPDESVPDNANGKDTSAEFHENHHSRRTKRAQPSFEKPFCTLLMVGDYEFYKFNGFTSEDSAVNYIISRVHMSHLWFKNTVFDRSAGLYNLGIILQEVRVHLNYTEEKNHYNADQAWRTSEIFLEAFMKQVEGREKFCLVHLLTNEEFVQGVMGLAYLGGICKSTNAGFSTLKSKAMALTGLDVTRTVAHAAIAGEGVCGDFLVDVGEECDVGFNRKRNDSCCTDKCKLKPGAACSDVNHKCCKKCKIAPTTQMCYAENLLHCESSSYCDGKTAICPPPKPLQDGTTCLYDGTCIGGKCLSFCTVYGRSLKEEMFECFCDRTVSARTACKRCCTKGNGSKCIATDVDRYIGESCHFGVCTKELKCVPEENDEILRIDSYMDIFDRDIMEELKYRTIAIWLPLVTMVIWVLIACCCLMRQDQKRRRICLEKATEIRRRQALERAHAEAEAQAGPNEPPMDTTAPLTEWERRAPPTVATDPHASLARATHVPLERDIQVPLARGPQAPYMRAHEVPRRFQPDFWLSDDRMWCWYRGKWWYAYRGQWYPFYEHRWNWRGHNPYLVDLNYTRPIPRWAGYQ